MTGTHHEEATTTVAEPERTVQGRRPAGVIIAAVVVMALAAGGTWSFLASRTPAATETTPSIGAGAGTGSSTIDADLTSQLVYLVEEEKLAYDLYILGESLYGSRVFTNISNSESTHQASVRQLLTTYGLADPSTELAPGVFTVPALQTLYDELSVRMKTSEAQAAQVGILIEETDITDLREALAASPPADIATVLTRLEAASQNHLRAFTRYADRV